MVFVVAAVALLAWAAIQQWPAVVDAAGRMRAQDLVAATGWALVGLGAQVMSWRCLLLATGSRVAFAPSAHVYLVGQLGKYVPGSVWAVVGQAEMGRAYGVSRARTAVVALASLAVLVVTGAAGGAAVHVLTAGDLQAGLTWPALVLVAAGAVALAPPVFNRLLALGARLVRRPLVVGRVAGGALAASAAWALVMWAAFGAHAWALAVPLMAPEAGASDVLRVASAYALAWVVGLVVVVAPAGAGAREGALVALLAPLVGTSDALVVAVASRGLMMAADALAAGIGVLPVVLRRARRSPERLREPLDGEG